jgi:IgGFc binding protein
MITPRRSIPLLAALALGCAAGAGPGGTSSSGSGGGGGAGGSDTVFTPDTCPSGEIICSGSTAKTCDGKGAFSGSTDCTAQSKKCAPGYGCVSCVPYSPVQCQNGKGTMCDALGQGTVDFDCDPEQGMVCKPDGCHGACSPVEIGPSYIGCEYWPTITWNGVLSHWFHFAAAIANASESPANVKVTQGATMIASATIPPGSLKILDLPWVVDLKGEDSGSGILVSLPKASVLSKGGGYRLRSDQPVTVYQFNALEYQNKQAPTTPTCMNPTACCPDPNKTGGCYSYSNDASLLLPTTSLASNYDVLGYRTLTSGLAAIYDFMAITATRDNTQVSFLVTTSTTAGGGVKALSTGQTGTVTLNTGDVFALLDSGTSLSGTRVWSPNGQPFQLLTGSPAAEIPDGVHAADHIEEIVPPVESLGKDYIVTVPTTPLGKKIHTVRIQAVMDGTPLTFDPPEVHAAMTIDAWQTLELVGVTEDFRVTSSSPFGVTQYMHGQGTGVAQPGAAGAGDPSQGLGIATQQYRTKYIFLAPADYDTNYVNISAPAKAKVMLDGVEIPASEMKPLSNTPFAVARHQLDAKQFHEIHADQPFGIVVYGYGLYTSYMYPGGMDVKHIADVPTPK